MTSYLINSLFLLLSNTQRSLMKKILFSLLLISTAFTLKAQNGYWEETLGPPGGNFTLIKTPNEVLYAKNAYQWQETYRSFDGGDTWEKLYFLQDTFIDSQYKEVKIGAAGTIFLHMLSGSTIGWFRTNDDGQTWTPMDNWVVDFVELPSGVLVGDRVTQLVRSTNGGQSWEVVLNHNDNVYAVIDPFVGLIATEGSSGQPNPVMFRSFDEGLTWTSVDLSISYLQYFFAPSGTLFCTDNNGLYRSTNGGNTFVTVNIPDLSSTISMTALANGRLFLDSDDALYFSDTDGFSWQVLQTHPSSGKGFFQPLSPLNNGKIFKSHFEAILASTNGAETWQFSSTGLHPASVRHLKFETDNTFYAATRIGIWKTENAGEDWQQISQQTNDNSISFDINSTGGIAFFEDNKLFWSATGNAPFSDITPPLNGAYGSVSWNPTNNHLFVSASSKVWRSKSFGQSWELVYSQVSLGFSPVGYHPSGRIFMANYSDKILYSDDDGDTWSSVTVSDAASISNCRIAPNGDTYFIGRNGSDYFLYKSEDAGITWDKLPTHIALGAWSNSTFTIAVNGHLYYGDGSKTIYVSVDEGLSWQTLPSFFSNPNYGGFDHLAISPLQRLFACSSNYGLYKSTAPVIQGAYIEGYAHVDADSDCSTLDAQQPLKNGMIEATGANYSVFTNTDANGHYIFFVDTGTYQVAIQNPNNIWWAYCDSSQTITLPTLFATDTVDFIALPLSFCPLMTVNIGIPQLRRCFNNDVFVSYCNQGAETAESAWVDLTLDPYLTFISSAQPHTVLGSNTIRFFVGDIGSGECSQFHLIAQVDCDSTVVGQTHCVTAHGFPDTLCTIVPSWSGANIEALVSCGDTALQFILKNTGSAHSQSLDYIIIEDDIVLMTGQQDYDVADQMVLEFPANGRTWRIESEQEPGHPFSTLALAFAEGCGGFNSLGYINQFTVNGIQPSWHRMCVENIGSYDPNDKQGFPNGVGPDHNIRPGQTIDYLIRFQNTGTDTAFTVTVRDTLSPFLNPLNIRPGASSQPYTWELSGQGVISFTFKNIMLPDSNVNEPASHGFVQFSIAPYADVPLGSVIENSAAIYFDFNVPVITNTTWHTIQQNIISSTVLPQSPTQESRLEVWPNPFSEHTIIHVGQKTSGPLQLNVFNNIGDMVAQKSAVGPDIELNIKHLPTGVYWARIQDKQGRLVGTGKLVKE